MLFDAFTPYFDQKAEVLPLELDHLPQLRQPGHGHPRETSGVPIRIRYVFGWFSYCPAAGGGGGGGDTGEHGGAPDAHRGVFYRAAVAQDCANLMQKQCFLCARTTCASLFHQSVLY